MQHLERWYCSKLRNEQPAINEWKSKSRQLVAEGYYSLIYHYSHGGRKCSLSRLKLKALQSLSDMLKTGVLREWSVDLFKPPLSGWVLWPAQPKVELVEFQASNVVTMSFPSQASLFYIYNFFFWKSTFKTDKHFPFLHRSSDNDFLLFYNADILLLALHSAYILLMIFFFISAKKVIDSGSWICIIR